MVPAEITTLLGNEPTSSPAQYCVSYSYAQESSNSELKQSFGSVIASHSDAYTLWDDKDVAAPSILSYVMDGNANQITEELSAGFNKNLISDFIISTGLLTNNTFDEENLVVDAANPYVSFLSRADMGSNAPPFFTGASSIEFCGPEGVDLCEVWFESITVPLFLYKIANSTHIHHNATGTSGRRNVDFDGDANIVQRVKSGHKNEPVGYLTFTRNITADSDRSADVVEEHMVFLKKRRTKRWIFMFILSVLALFAFFLFMRLMMEKYADYRPIP